MKGSEGEEHWEEPVQWERHTQAQYVFQGSRDLKILLHFLVWSQLCVCSGSVSLGSARGILTWAGFESGALFSLLFILAFLSGDRTNRRLYLCFGEIQIYLTNRISILALGIVWILQENIIGLKLGGSGKEK